MLSVQAGSNPVFEKNEPIKAELRRFGSGEEEKTHNAVGGRAPLDPAMMEQLANNPEYANNPQFAEMLE